jgi:hypothetical protein
MTTQPTTHKDRFPCAARYGTYVGRVGALAVALGIGAAVATGHGLGLGVAYAGEGDSTSGETADNGDGGGDDGDGTPTAPPAPAAAPGDSKPSRSPLARISDVPKMIFNATGGAKTSTTNRTQPKLPHLSKVLDNVAAAVTNNLPKVPESAKHT